MVCFCSYADFNFLPQKGAYHLWAIFKLLHIRLFGPHKSMNRKYRYRYLKKKFCIWRIDTFCMY